jgi:hypothetical protein
VRLEVLDLLKKQFHDFSKNRTRKFPACMSINCRVALARNSLTYIGRGFKVFVAVTVKFIIIWNMISCGNVADLSEIYNTSDFSVEEQTKQAKTGDIASTQS